METRKVVKVSPLAGIAARKGFWLLLAHKSNQVKWRNAWKNKKYFYQDKAWASY